MSHSSQSSAQQSKTKLNLCLISYWQYRHVAFYLPSRRYFRLVTSGKTRLNLSNKLSRWGILLPSRLRRLKSYFYFSHVFFCAWQRWRTLASERRIKRSDEKIFWQISSEWRRLIGMLYESREFDNFHGNSLRSVSPLKAQINSIMCLYQYLSIAGSYSAHEIVFFHRAPRKSCRKIFPFDIPASPFRKPLDVSCIPWR